MASLQAARNAKHRAMKLLSTIPEVNGVGVTRVDDGWGLKVNVSRRPGRRLPADVDGVPLVPEIVGDVVAQT